MVTLRVVRHDRHEQVLAECQSTRSSGARRGDSARYDRRGRRDDAAEHALARRLGDRARAVAARRPRRRTERRSSVKRVEVTVLPDVSLVPEFAAAAEQILSESKM